MNARFAPAPPYVTDYTPAGPAVHAARRAALAERLRAAGGGMAVVAAAPERRRNGDSDHPYRYDSYLHYLSGFAEPHAWLVLDSAGNSTLFCQPKDETREIWDGVRVGPQAAPQVLGLDAAFALGELDTRVPALLMGQPALWTLAGLHDSVAARVETWLASLRSHTPTRVDAGPPAQRDLTPLLNEMRLIKDAQEIAAMRHAGRISADAHARAMRACRPGLHEYELEAELLHEFRRRGAEAPAYPSIVAGGANACVLHHPAGPALLRDGELCLIDAGCEVDGYASDITRTFPVNGRYSPAQRALYDVVLAAQTAAVDATRPGARKQDAHWAAVRVLSQGLLDLGLLSADRHGSLDDIVEHAAYRRYYMHGTGHWLGLDVHDVGDYLSQTEEAVQQPDGQGQRVLRKPSRRLEPGMVITIEPGLYVRPAPDVPERYWNIGIRIEDDAVVTPTGCELISRGVPVAADEIEALMREAP